MLDLGLFLIVHPICKRLWICCLTQDLIGIHCLPFTFQSFLVFLAQRPDSPAVSMPTLYTKSLLEALTHSHHFFPIVIKHMVIQYLSPVCCGHRLHTTSHLVKRRPEGLQYLTINLTSSDDVIWRVSWSTLVLMSMYMEKSNFPCDLEIHQQ